MHGMCMAYAGICMVFTSSIISVKSLGERSHTPSIAPNRPAYLARVRCGEIGAGFGVWGGRWGLGLGLGLGVKGLAFGLAYRVLGRWGLPSADIVVGDADGVAEAHELDRL